MPRCRQTILAHRPARTGTRRGVRHSNNTSRASALPVAAGTAHAPNETLAAGASAMAPLPDIRGAQCRRTAAGGSRELRSCACFLGFDFTKKNCVRKCSTLFHFFVHACGMQCMGHAAIGSAPRGAPREARCMSIAGSAQPRSSSTRVLEIMDSIYGRCRRLYPVQPYHGT